ADESHDLESLLIDAQNQQQNFTGELKAQVLARQETLARLIDELKQIVRSGLAASVLQAPAVPVAKKASQPGAKAAETKVVVKAAKPNKARERQKANQAAAA